MKLKIVFTSASQRKHSGWTKFLVSPDGCGDRHQQSHGRLSGGAEHDDHARHRHAALLSSGRQGAAKAALGLPADKKIAGCFGRVRHQKGTDLFVESMISLLPRRPDWIAIVAGRATPSHQAFETELKERVKSAGLAERILFVGEHTNIPTGTGRSTCSSHRSAGKALA
jgi:mannosyltransferase